MMTVEEAKKYKVIKHKCLTDFMFFVRYFFKTMSGSKFLVNFHHELIATDLIDVANYNTKFLNINIPPRYSKTELAAVMFIAWGIAKNPRASFLYITGSDKLANETSTRIRKIISSFEFQFMFGVKLSSDQKAKGLWRTQQGGGLMCATILGQITGFGAGSLVNHFADEAEKERIFEGAVIFDDINKIDAAIKNSKTNETINDVIFSTVIPSRENSTDTPIINIQQRAGFDDATAQLKEHYKGKPKVKILTLPVIYQGKPLWEHKHNMVAIEDIRTSPKTAYTFESQYMQDPTPKEGLGFHESMLQFFTMEEYNNENKTVTVSYIDTADRGNDDYSHPIADIIGDRIYIKDVVFNKMALSINKYRSISKVKEHDIRTTTVETNKEGTFYKDTLSETLRGYSIRGRFNSTNKHGRIISFEDFIKTHVVFRSDYAINSEYYFFMQCLTKYKRDGTSKHDDAPDSIAGLCQFVWDNYRSQFRNRKKEES